MVLLFPRHTDDDVKPISEGLGHVLLASSRAYHAARNIAFYRLGEDELETEKFMIGVNSGNVAEKLAKLCAQTGMELDECIRLTEACERYAGLYTSRNRLVHDEWWVWPGAGVGEEPDPAKRSLVLRQIDRKTGAAKHDENWNAERLGQLATALDSAADELDVFGYKPAAA